MNLYAHITGQGPALVILHGLYGCSDNWMSIARSLAASGHTVCVPDLRNHGRSPNHPEHSYRVMAADVVAWMEQTGLEQAVILGHSMGGKVATWLAAAHPRKVRALILADIAPVGYASLKEYSPHVVEHLNIMTALEALDIARIHTRQEAEQALAPQIPDRATRQFLLKNLQRDAQGTFFWRMNLPVLKQALPEILGGMDPLKLGHPNLIEGIPALCIRGERSSYVGVQEQIFLQQAIPGIKIVTLTNAGYWVHAEQPGMFLSAVQNFLKDLDA